MRHAILANVAGVLLVAGAALAGGRDITVVTGKFKSYKDGLLTINDLRSRQDQEFKLGPDTTVVSMRNTKQKLPLATAFDGVNVGRIIRVYVKGKEAQVEAVQIGVGASVGGRPAPGAQKAYLVSIIGQGASVWRVAFSPDGATLAACVGGKEHPLKLWDVATRKSTGDLIGHEGFVACLAFAPDGKTLASGGDDKTVRLWDLAGRQQRHTLQGHASAVNAVAFSPDGTLLASASKDGTVRLWDALAGKLLFSLRHGAEVYSLAFRPDGKTLATGADDKMVRLWDPATGKARAAMPDKGPVKVLLYTPDGQKLVTTDGGPAFRVWDLAAKKRKNHPGAKDGARIVCMALSTSGKVLATGGSGKNLHLWDLATGHELATLTTPLNTFWSVAFSPDQQLAATAGGDEAVRLWAVAAITRAGSAPAPSAKDLVGVWEMVKGLPPGATATMQFTSDGKMHVTATFKGKTFTAQGTYKVEGNTVHSVLYEDGREQKETHTIQVLNRTTLITRDEKGTIQELRRKN
jgi:uncharacterized protein (TIGR03066 family)